MAKQQRQIMIQQRGSLEAMNDLEQRSDEQLENETKYKTAALAILGARAAERYDAATARSYFQRAIASAHPQERIGLKKMRNASMALAERRPDDLKEAVEKLGQTPPSGRQLFMLRLMGLIAPPPGASALLRLRGMLLILALIAAIIGVGLGVVELVALPFGGVGLISGILLGLLVAVAALAVLALLGRRKQSKLKANRGGGG